MTTTIEASLKGMKIGATRVINGRVVTRWGSDHYEMTTWGKNLVTATVAAQEIARTS